MEKRDPEIDEIIQALTERAVRLWGPERAEAARSNIAEAAMYIKVIGDNPPGPDVAPLFHP